MASLVHAWEQKGRQKGEQEGIEKGIQQEKRVLASKLLANGTLANEVDKI